MVRAILDGSKTQTRRILKIPPTDADYQHADLARARFDNSYLKPDLGNVPCLKIPYGPEGGELSTVQRFFPPHKPGDQLWVKETWRTIKDYNNLKPIDLHEITPIYYEADERTIASSLHAGRIRQSIFMRKFMSRITLQISDVRIQRLQDISEEDAGNEGAGFILAEHEYLDGNPDQYRQCFQILWNSINGQGAWDQNPFVVAYTFTRAKQ